MRYAISGPIGSGKSTVSSELSKLTGYRVYSGGEFFRETAKRIGMSIEEFNIYAEKHPEMDYETDNTEKEFLEKNDNIIVESRLSGWICKNNSINAIKVYLYATYYTRVFRFSNRENMPISEASYLLESRENSEKKRYMDLYGFDMDDKSIYDIVINTEFLNPKEIAGIIYEHGRVYSTG
ncbi:MAG: (d)CMP kinase [Thermoplasmata archaeon]